MQCAFFEFVLRVSDNCERCSVEQSSMASLAALFYETNRNSITFADVFNQPYELITGHLLSIGHLCPYFNWKHWDIAVFPAYKLIIGQSHQLGRQSKYIKLSVIPVMNKIA